MKHTLVFDLPSDQYELDIHTNISRYIATIVNIQDVVYRIRNDPKIYSEELDAALDKICSQIPKDLPL